MRPLSSQKRSVKIIWIKMYLFILSVFCWVAGLTLAVVGAVVELKIGGELAIMKQLSMGIADLLIAVGLIIFVFAFLGTMAIICDHTAVIKTCFTVLLILFIVEIGSSILVFIHNDKIHTDLLQGYRGALESYSTDPHVKQSVDELQRQLQCCGAVGYNDWLNTSLKDSIPDSCCETEKPNCGTGVLSNKTRHIYTQGCIDSIELWLHKRNRIIGWVGATFGLTQILGMLFFCLLFRTLQVKYVPM